MKILQKHPTLSDTQLVLMLSNGWTLREIAEQYDINLRTLEAAIERMKTKHDCRNTPHLVATYFRNLLIA